MTLSALLSSPYPSETDGNLKEVHREVLKGNTETVFSSYAHVEAKQAVWYSIVANMPIFVAIHYALSRSLKWTPCANGTLLPHSNSGNTSFGK